MQSVTVGKRKYKSQKKRKRIISTEKKANYK